MKTFAQFEFCDEDGRGEYKASVKQEDQFALHLFYVRIQQVQINGVWRTRGMGIWDDSKKEWMHWSVGRVTQKALQEALGLTKKALPEKTEEPKEVTQKAAPTISFGKHNGKTFEQIAQLDWNYLEWMAHERISRGGVNFSKLAEKYIDTHAEPEIDVCPVCHETSCDGWHWNRRR